MLIQIENAQEVAHPAINDVRLYRATIAFPVSYRAKAYRRKTGTVFTTVRAVKVR